MVINIILVQLMLVLLMGYLEYNYQGAFILKIKNKKNGLYLYKNIIKTLKLEILKKIIS